MKNMVRVLHFVRSITKTFGTYNYLIKLFNGLKQYNIEQSVLAYEETYIQGKEDFSFPIWTLNKMVHLDKYIDNKVDIVHFHDVYPHYIFWKKTDHLQFYSLCKKKKLVRTIHDYASSICPNYYGHLDQIYCETNISKKCLKKNCIDSRTYVQYIQYIESLKDYNAILYFADNVKQSLQAYQISSDKLYQAPPLIRPQKVIPVEKENILLYVGRLSVEKGVHFLLKAVSQIKMDEWKLYIIGMDDYQYAHNLVQLVNKYNLKHKVQMLGYLKPSEIESYYQKAKILCFPSIGRETYGFSGAEAVSYGIPVVSFDIPGIKNWMRDEITGIRVPCFNDLAYARALELLLKDQSVYKRLQTNCIEWSRQLNFQEQLSVMNRIYRNI